MIWGRGKGVGLEHSSCCGLAKRGEALPRPAIVRHEDPGFDADLVGAHARALAIQRSVTRGGTFVTDTALKLRDVFKAEGILRRLS